MTEFWASLNDRAERSSIAHTESDNVRRGRYVASPPIEVNVAQRYFATINPGLEDALLAEVRELGGKRATALTGGVEFDATNAVFYRAVNELRCTNRLWLRVDEFRARDAPELFNKTKRIEWSRLIDPTTPIEIRAVSHRSGLNHTDRISKAVSDGIDEALGRKPVAGNQPIDVLARLVENRCELSLDASGDLLYQRGYKTEAVAAPLRESIASAVLRLIGWTPDDALLDPFCGSGTIVIEAAQQAAGIPAGRARNFAMEKWANFRPDLWAEVRAYEPRLPSTKYRGTDVDPAAVDAARHNATRGHVEDWCKFDVTDVADLEPPDGPPGWIVTNPPWNLRLADPTHSGLNRLLDTFAARFAGWKLAVIAPRRWTPKGSKERTSFDLGGVPVSLRTFGVE